jgi:PAS domain S-box-containing protein
MPLRRSTSEETLYRQMVDEAADAIFLFDSAGRITYANCALTKLLGYSSRGIVGVALSHLFDLPSGTGWPKDFSKLTRRHSPRATCEANPKGRSAIQVDLRIRRLDTQHCLGIARDVSKDIALAEHDRRQTAYYRSLFRNNISGVLVLGENLRITSANHALTTLLKCAERDLVGHTLIEFVDAPSQDLAKRMLYDMQHLRSFNARYRKGLRLQLKRSDGSAVILQSAFSAIGDGVVRFRQGIGIFTDVTEELRLRDERDEQARFNATLIAHAPICIMVTDPLGRILQINPALEQLTGFRQRDVRGKTGWDSGLMHDDDKPGSMQRYKELLIGATPRTTALLRLHTKRDGIKLVETFSTLVRKPTGEPAFIVLTGNDVTEQKRLEAEIVHAAEAEQRRLGHDLHDGVGQVLTGVLSLSEALQSDLPPALQGELGRIRDLIREAIQQVRSLSHGLSPGAVKHRPLADSLLWLTQSVSNKYVRCHFETDGGVTLASHDAETQLYRVAQEAVQNAFRHAQPKNVTVVLKKIGTSLGLLEIADDGIGLKHCKSKNPEGMGLRVMRYRINLLGGTFELRKGIGGGTVVACQFSCLH